jgi:hypothetical protein
MNQPTWLSDKWDSFTSSATEAVFEKTGFKADFTKTDPASHVCCRLVSTLSLVSLTLTSLCFRLYTLHHCSYLTSTGFKALGLTTPMMIIANFQMVLQRTLAIQRLAKAVRY